MEARIASQSKKPFELSESRVHLGPVGYYADFIIYPALVPALGIVALYDANAAQRLAWFGAVVAGVIAWTLLEYIMHRFVLHRIGFFDALHDLHHAAPRAMMGTPSWASLTFILFGVFAPLCLALGDFYGSGVTVGIMTGYLWYISVHHIAHHWQVDHDSYLYGAKRHHARHHYTGQTANFGVTTPIWDWLFGTASLPPSPWGKPPPE